MLELRRFPLLVLTFPWWTFRIFFIFFCSGRGKEEFEAPGGGGNCLFIENTRRGGSPGREGPRGQEGVCGKLGNGGGGGWQSIFFFGAGVSTKFLCASSFLFFSLATPTPHQAFCFTQTPPLSGTSELLYLQRKGNLQGLGVVDGVWRECTGKNQKNVRNPNHHYFSKKYRNTPPICIAIRLQFVLQWFRCPYTLRKGKYFQYSSHLYGSTPPICVAIRLPFVSQYFWENLGGCGHRDVPPKKGISNLIAQTAWIARSGFL